MTLITKEDVQAAFVQKKRKRMDLLILYYGEFLFDRSLPTDFIVDKINSELNINLNREMLWNLKAKLNMGFKSHLNQDQKKHRVENNASSPLEINQSVIKDEIVFRNADETKIKPPFSEVFAHLKKSQ